MPPETKRPEDPDALREMVSEGYTRVLEERSAEGAIRDCLSGSDPSERRRDARKRGDRSLRGLRRVRSAMHAKGR